MNVEHPLPSSRPGSFGRPSESACLSTRRLRVSRRSTARGLRGSTRRLLRYPPNYGIDLTAWGWFWLIVGLVQLLAGVLILQRNMWGLWLGVGIACLARS